MSYRVHRQTDRHTDNDEYSIVAVGKRNYNNKVMYHQSMKLSHMFDPNTMYTSDKIVVKHISVKETLLKLDLESKGQGHSEKQNNMQGNKNIPPPIN